MVKQIDSNEFKEIIKEGKVAVDLFATWCGPCKMLSPILDEISEEVETTKFYKIDVDENQDIAIEYGVMSIPTVLIFENGELINKIVGLKSREDLVEQFK
jgi:thioredoxin 1